MVTLITKTMSQPCNESPFTFFAINHPELLQMILQKNSDEYMMNNLLNFLLACHVCSSWNKTATPLLSDCKTQLDRWDPLTYNLYTAAIVYARNFEVVKWLHTKLNYPINKMTEWDCLKALKKRQINVLMYRTKHGTPANNLCFKNTKFCQLITRMGELNLMIWARDNGCVWTDYVSREAASCGHLQLLEWLEPRLYAMEKLRSSISGSLIDPRELPMGDFDLKFIFQLSHGVLWGSPLCMTAINAGQLHILKWLCSPERNNRFGVVPLSEKMVYAAASAKRNSIEMIEFMMQRGCKAWDPELTRCAVFSGNLELLRWLRDSQPEPCPWSPRSVQAAAKGGHLHLLRWMMTPESEGGPRCNRDMINQELLELCNYASAASIRDHNLELLKFARSLNPPCPWSENNCKNAVRDGDMETLQWLRDETVHGKDLCPWNAGVVDMAISWKRKEMLVWLRENGCPGDYDAQ